MEYFTTTEVAKYLNLTNKLRIIFDLDKVVHRLINSEFYERVTLVLEKRRRKELNGEREY